MIDQRLMCVFCSSAKNVDEDHVMPRSLLSFPKTTPLNTCLGTMRYINTFTARWRDDASTRFFTTKIGTQAPHVRAFLLPSKTDKEPLDVARYLLFV